MDRETLQSCLKKYFGQITDPRVERTRAHQLLDIIAIALFAVLFEPGHYLCIVPDRWGQRHDRLFLPFAEQGDSKIAEVISKVLLLANDDKIKDKSILRQIQTYR